MNFAEWINSELEKRGWSRREAARRGEMSPSLMDKVINGYSKPGLRFFVGIAQAFEMSAEEVMSIYRNTPRPVPLIDRKIQNLVLTLPLEEKQIVLDFIEHRHYVADKKATYEVKNSKSTPTET